MGAQQLLATSEPKIFRFDLHKYDESNLVNGTDSIIKYNNEHLAEHTTKNESIELIFKNTENSKTNEPHKFILNLPHRLSLRRSKKSFVFF